MTAPVMLDGLFVTPAVTAITEALGTAKAVGRIAVVGNAKLATALAAKRAGPDLEASPERGASPDREVLPVGLTPRAAKKLTNAVPDFSTVEPSSLAAVIGVDVADDDAWVDTLRTWSRVVRDGGAIVFVDRGHAAEASRRALCAGLTELEQRHVGRTVITSGLVTHLEQVRP